MDNIYDSNNYKKTRTNIKKRAKNKNIQSSNVKKTGMIPKNYNQKKFMNKLNSENKIKNYGIGHEIKKDINLDMNKMIKMMKIVFFQMKNLYIVLNQKIQYIY
jgi:hypothetical protein